MGATPVVGLPSLGRVLVVAPHPDDESVGPGGTAALLSRAGTEVHVVVLTDGAATSGTRLAAQEIARRRRRETVQACRVLGLTEPRFLGFADDSLSGRIAELAGALAAVIGEVGPEAIFLPWFGDGHPDHRAPAAAMARTGVPARVQLWGYETWAPLPANRVVDVSSVISLKEEAVAAHRTAHAAFDLQAMLALNRYRSVHGLAGHGWAEGFLVAPADRFLALAAAFDEGARTEPP